MLAVLFLPLIGLVAESPVPQTTPESQTEDLIQRMRRLDGLNGTGVSLRACDLEQDKEAHRAALALANIGSRALPGIQEALNAGMLRPSSTWLLYSYARIRGPGAFDELIKTASVQSSAEGARYLRAAAVARGITSVVNGRHDMTLSHSGRMIVCNALEPRHTLDLFLVALLRGDRRLLTQSMGPSGRAQLAALRDQEIFPSSGRSREDHYISYKMENWDAWSELAPEHSHEALRSDQTGVAVNLNIEFLNRLGTQCVRRSLRFQAVPTESGELLFHMGEVEYRIEPEHLSELLEDIRGCVWVQ